MDKDEESSKEAAREEKKETKKRISIGYFSYFKIIIVLLFVIGLIYAASYFIKRTLNIKGEVSDGAAVIINQPLGPGKWLQVVYVAGKYLVLGVTNDNVNLISEVKEPKEIERLEVLLNNKKTEDGGNFIDIISDFFKDKIKKVFTKQSFDYENDSLEFLKKQKDRIKKMNNDKEK